MDDFRTRRGQFFTGPTHLVVTLGLLDLMRAVALPWVVAAAGGWALPPEPPSAPVVVVTGPASGRR